MKKRYLFSAAAALLLATSCGESVDSKAGRLLQEATAAFSAGEYQNAKLLIDSIRNSYPKAFEARRGALELMRDVELAEQQAKRNRADFGTKKNKKRTRGKGA